jgi:hypothetical protein
MHHEQGHTFVKALMLQMNVWVYDCSSYWMCFVQYSMASKDFKQNVSTSENSVIYHVSRDSVEAWIVQNFDTVSGYFSSNVNSLV